MNYLKRTFRLMRAVFVPDDHKTLEACLSKALRDRPKALTRREPIDSQGDSFRFINTHRSVGGCLCGVVCSYTKGQNQMTIALDENATELPVEQMAPSKDPRKRAEFIEGIMYFCVKDNHLIIVGSQVVGSSQFERHVNWLLNTTGVIDLSQSVMTADPDTRKIRKHRFDNVKSLRFSPDLHMSGREARESADGRKSVSYKPDGAGWNAFVALLDASGIHLPAIDFDPTLKPDDLELSIEIIHKRRRDAFKEPTPILDPLANAFRHDNNVDFEIEFRDGTKLRGDELKVSVQKSIACQNGIPVVAEVFRSMVSFLEDMLKRPDVI